MAKIELLDGAMGSELLKRGHNVPQHTWSANINIDNPLIVEEIHKEYINAGSNYITTNTFRTTPRAFIKSGLNTNEATDIAKKSLNGAINVAKNAKNNKTKVLGSVAPLEDCYMPDLFPGKSYAKKEFNNILDSLYNAGIDIFLLETMNSITETRSCLEVIHESNLPIWVSFNLLDSIHIKSGETLVNAIKMTADFDVDCILLNCNPIERTKESLKIVSENCLTWGIYPNLGIGEPSPDGVISNYYSDEDFLNLCKKAIDLGASVIGGCCGTSPRHIKLLRDNLLE